MILSVTPEAMHKSTIETHGFDDPIFVNVALDPVLHILEGPWLSTAVF